MFFATIIIAIMYLGLTFSLAEMSPALPHTGGAYSFARTSMGPWAGYITGIAREYRVRAHAGRDRVLHRLVSHGDLRHGSELPAGLLDPRATRYSSGSTSSALSCRSRSRVTVTLLALAVSRGLLPVGDLLRQVRLFPLGAQHGPRTASSCPMAAARSCPSAFRASSPPCRSPCGCSSPSSNCRWRRRNRTIRSGTCRRASSPAS